MDTLITTINITLTTEQSAYLQENKSEPRTKLYKMFNLHFRTAYTKLQITQALENLNDPKPKPAGASDKPKNVYWSQGMEIGLPKSRSRRKPSYCIGVARKRP